MFHSNVFYVTGHVVSKVYKVFLSNIYISFLMLEVPVFRKAFSLFGNPWLIILYIYAYIIHMTLIHMTVHLKFRGTNKNLWNFYAQLRLSIKDVIISNRGNQFSISSSSN